jgi:hypothetical protein
MDQATRQRGLVSGQKRAAAGAVGSQQPAWLWEVFPYLPAAALVPGALGVVALAGRGPRWLRNRPWLAGLLTLGSVAALARWQMGRFFNEQPPYVVEGEREGLELRRYPARVVAETTVQDVDWDQGLSEGFRRLAGYIFGGNSGQQKVAMTSPVNASATTTGRSPAQRLAMTSPVTATAADREITVTFTMPREHALATLPVPHDARVRLRTDAERRVAVLKYRGTYRAAITEAKQAELLRRVQRAGLTPVGPPVFAGYDAPATLPFLRRLEAWVAIA